MDLPLTVAWPIRTDAVTELAALVLAGGEPLALVLALPQPAANRPIPTATPTAAIRRDADPRNHTVKSPLSR